MKKLWQNSNLPASLRETVSGISGYVKQNQFLVQPRDDEQQFLRLPLESAKMLRWYDRGELNQLVRSHARERQELEDVNDALRKVLLDSGVGSERVDLELLHKIKQVDFDRNTQDGVCAALLLSLTAELDSLKSQGTVASSNDPPESRMQSSTSSGPVAMTLIVTDGRVSVTLRVNDEASQASGREDMEQLMKLLDGAIDHLSDAHDESILMDGTKASSVLLDLRDALSGMSHSLRTAAELQKQLDTTNAEKRQLDASLRELSEKHKDRRGQVPADVLLRAQNMCATAGERSRASGRRAELAETRALKSEKSEQDARTELQKVQTDCEEYQRRLKDLEAQKYDLSIQLADLSMEKTKLESVSSEDKRMILQQAAELSGSQEGLKERDELAITVSTLQNNLNDLKTKADMSDYYKQLVREQEHSSERAEEELLSTAKVVSGLEKRLKEAHATAQQKEAKCHHLETKYRELQKSIESQVAERLDRTMSDNSRSNNFDEEVSSLQGELRMQLVELKAAQARAQEAEALVTQEAVAKKDLLGQMKAMEDRLVSVTKEKASIIVNLKRDLAESNREKAAKEEFLNQIQQEYQALAKGSRVITNQSKVANGSRGGGSFHETQWPTLESKTVELSGIDAVYLKNVVLKFIEATAKGKVRERDALLPAVATVLQASPSEFKALKSALNKETGAQSLFMPSQLFRRGS